MAGRYAEPRSAREALGVPTTNPLRDQARKYLEKILARLERDAGDDLPRITEAQQRGCQFVLQVYRSAIDEFAAENPAPQLSVSGVSALDLKALARGGLS